ncbi:hypothetical protein COY27_00750 [Candidatus Woesearchaeota archaeon CG_4_10_14_0_2_um_filter_33_13]|nr:MAG: hypothetical protein COY27_00750 [Candidatus Woesearchaeota archaeon CG_4_10_14_0_2_um_filter_33_13]
MIRTISIDTIIEPVQGHSLPFVPKGPVEISQGYNGPFSHLAFSRGLCNVFYDYRFAIDFKLALGTEVIASKAGVVFYVIDYSKSLYRGTDLTEGIAASPNLVIVAHEDGLKSCYSHLDGNNIFVERGEVVEQGQPLARTGLSGWIGPVPHLHFQVYTGPRTFPVVFTNYGGPLEDRLLKKE